jgi:hypothetical protein
MIKFERIYMLSKKVKLLTCEVSERKKRIPPQHPAYPREACAHVACLRFVYTELRNAQAPQGTQSLHTCTSNTTTSRTLISNIRGVRTISRTKDKWNCGENKETEV